MLERTVPRTRAVPKHRKCPMSTVFTVGATNLSRRNCPLFCSGRKGGMALGRLCHLRSPFKLNFAIGSSMAPTRRHDFCSCVNSRSAPCANNLVGAFDCGG